MKTYRYIIVGGGMTGSAAVMGIRENDPDGSIAMFTKEFFEPYNRPPLTKGLWSGKNVDSIIRPMDKYEIDLFLGTAVINVHPQENQIITEEKELFEYQYLLLATGGDPIQFPDAPEGVIAYRTRSDFHQLMELTENKNHLCIIGGGFIGSELAAALVNNKKQVTMIFPEIGICGTIFPDDLSAFLVEYYQDKGVSVLHGNLVDAISKAGDSYKVQYHNIESKAAFEAEFDAVVVGIGIRPNSSLAENAGIVVEDGIVVNEFLQTNIPNVFAAGDVANFLHVPLGKRLRVEHEDNANTMGMIAGKNMSGDMQPYDHFPFFYSDLFDLGYEAVGDLDKNLEIFEDWLEPYKKGTVYYLQDGKIRGLIFWNLWGKVDHGREVIQLGKTYKKSDLQGFFVEE